MKNHCKQIVLILSVIALISSCHKDLYSPDTIKEDFFIQNIPVGFDWSTLSSVDVNITPNDIYGGKYFYTLEIFDQNPILNQQAILFAKGVGKEGQPFRSEIAIPENITSVFIRQTAPTGKKSVQLATISNNTLKCSFIPVAPAASQSLIRNTGITAAKKQEINWQIPGDAKEITGNGTFTMKKNESYVIRNNYTGSIVFPPEGKGILYIAGTWNNTGQQTNISQNSEIYILNGGRLLSENAWQIATQNTTIAIAQEGQFGSKDNKNIDIEFNNPSELTNEGIFYAHNITTHTGSTDIINNKEFHIGNLVTNNPGLIENNGVFTAEEMSLNHPNFFNNEKATLAVKKLTTENGYVYNKHMITASTITFNRTKVENECSIHTTDLFISAGSYEQAGYTSMVCENMRADGVTLTLNSFSMLVANEKVTFTSYLNKINGNGKDFAVFKTGEMIWAEVGPHAQFSGNLEINCSKFKDNPPYNPYYRLSGAAYFAENGTSVNIPASTCTGNGNNPEEGQPENPEFPFPEHMTQPHAWIIEDTYPSPGDYDMNDLVINVDSIVKMINKDNATESMTLHLQLRAVGGMRHIGSALQLDGISPQAIQSVTYSDNVKFSDNTFETAQNGVETGQTYAVVPLFDNAHKIMGVPNTTTMINTVSLGAGTTHKETVNLKITITFTQPVPGNILSINKLNFFAVVGQATGNMRDVEIHLPEFKHTDKSSTPSEVQQSTKGLMWGLLIPGNFRYAEERTDIRSAYPQFQDWVTSDKQNHKDWYNYPEENNIYKKQ